MGSTKEQTKREQRSSLFRFRTMDMSSWEKNENWRTYFHSFQNTAGGFKLKKIDFQDSRLGFSVLYCFGPKIYFVGL